MSTPPVSSVEDNVLPPAPSKAIATARMYFLGGQHIEPLGPGSKEKKSALVALGKFVGLELNGVGGKVACGAEIANVVGVTWHETCYSAGDTITLVGMNLLIDQALRWWQATNVGAPVTQLVVALVAIKPAPRSDDLLEGTNMSAHLNEVEHNIASLLAQLATSSALPEDVSVRDNSLNEDDIQISDGSWRTALASVQDWLGLPDRIDESTPDSFDTSLRELLGVSATDDTLFDRLQERLDRAVDLRDAFTDALETASEGAATLRTATNQWRTNWEDADEAKEAEASGSINARADVWAIQEFLSKADQSELILSPSYQRADVWPTVDAQKLIESILRGIPLPSVILLEQNHADGVYYEVVDGKQRLTAILRFTGRHPKALAIVEEKSKLWAVESLVSIFQQNYPEFKKLWRKHEIASLTASREREFHFPFPLRRGEIPGLSGRLEALRGKYYSQIQALAIDVVGRPRKVSTLFESVSDYRIPVILFVEAKPHQIHEVFTLYNKQGKHLNAEELRNATYHELDFMRALLATASDTDIDNLGEVAPFLASRWEELSTTGKNLSSYGFVDAGYKRSKTLSWMASILFLEDEHVESRSTAIHINNLLKRVQQDPKDPLRTASTIVEAMLLLDSAVDIHATISDETWAPGFKNAQHRGKWQELQLVASLTGLAAAAAVVPRNDLLELVEDSLDNLSVTSETWKRPDSAQSKNQWEFLSKVIRDMLALLGVDAELADEKLRELFGASGLAQLLRISEEA